MTDRIATELKAVLDDVDRALSERPAPMPPWENIQGFVTRSRERRRRRVAIVIGAVALAVVAVIAAQNLISPWSDRSTPKPVPAGPPSFERWEQPRGSLAGDRTWLRQLRSYTADHVLDEDGDQIPDRRPEPAVDVRVLYASDVGDFRIAVVLGEWPGLGGRNLSELFGPRGAAVEDLTQGRVGVASELAVGGDTLWNEFDANTPMRDSDPDRDNGRRPSAYFLSGEEREAVLQEPPTIDAAGKVTQHTRSLRYQDGAAEVTVDEPGHFAVLLPGLDDLGVDSYRDFLPQEPDEQLDPDRVDGTAARGGAGRSGPTLSWLAESTWLASRQTMTSGTWRLLASAPGATDVNRATVGLLTLPSGAQVVAAGHRESLEGLTTVALDTARLVPQGADQVSIAWATDADADREVQARSAALGPPGTVRVRWTTADGGTFSTDAENTLAVTPRTDVTGVRYLDADGRELGTDPVLAPEARRFYRAGDEDGSYPTRDNNTSSSGWLLPAVRSGLAGF